LTLKITCITSEFSVCQGIRTAEQAYSEIHSKVSQTQVIAENNQKLCGGDEWWSRRDATYQDWNNSLLVVL